MKGYVRFKLEDGKSYRTRDGSIARIWYKCPHLSAVSKYCFEGQVHIEPSGIWLHRRWSEAGEVWAYQDWSVNVNLRKGISSWDIIEEL